jgi:hypothetical protein
VSFTAVPLEKLHTLRVFRPHRGRWDFEPYGICIDLDHLRRLGVRPVTYVDRPGGAPSVDAWLQQRARTVTTGGVVIDWSVEREWRHLGDLNLRTIPGHAICLFVPSAAEARALRRVAGWPVWDLPRDWNRHQDGVRGDVWAGKRVGGAP